MPETRYPREEMIRRGQTLYEERIRSQVETAHRGKFLVLDVDTGDYEIETSELDALRRAKAKRPDAPLYLLRIGAPTAYKLGGRFRIDS